jgi:hypothetical protein
MKTHTTESLLTESLDKLKKTQDVAAVLEQYPDKAETLRPLLEAAQWTGAYYADVPRPLDGLEEGRVRALAFAATQRATVSGRRTVWGNLKRQNNLFWKFAGAVVAISLILIPLRGPLVSAARTTLPGNPLYSLKLSSEDQLFASMDDAEAQVVLAISLTDERVEEVRALVEKQQAIPVDVLYRTNYMFRTALMSAAWAPEPVMSSMLEYIIHHNRQQVQQLELLKMQATPKNLPMLNDIQTLCLKTQIIAMIAMENPETFREAYQAGTPEKMPLPSGGPLSGVVITDELRNLATSTPDSSLLPPATVPAAPILTPTAKPTPMGTPTPVAGTDF